MIERNPMPSPRLTGRHVLCAMILFFAVIIAVNLTMAVVASRSWSGLVVENGFVASQSFNRDLAEARRQASRNWSADFGFQDGQLRFLPRDAAGAPLSGFAVTVSLRRPATSRDDVTLSLGEAKRGEYLAAATVKSGLWDAEVIATSNSGEVFRQLYRIHVAGGP